MELYTFKNSKLIELTDKELRIYNKYRTYEYKLENIRAAYVTKDYLLHLVMKNGSRCVNLIEICNKDKALLEELTNKLNTENKIYYSPVSMMSTEVAAIWGAIWCCIGITRILIGDIFWALACFFVVWSYLKDFLIAVRPTEFWYDLKTKEITLKKVFKTEKFNTSDKFTVEYLTNYAKVFRIKNKRSIEIPDEFLYPKYYNKELIKLCDEKKL